MKQAYIKILFVGSALTIGVGKAESILPNAGKTQPSKTLIQPIQTRGTAYRGTIYTPFSYFTPSDYTSAAMSSSGSLPGQMNGSRRSPVVFDEDGWLEGADTGQSERNLHETPVGDPPLLAILGSLSLYYLTKKRKYATI